MNVKLDTPILDYAGKSVPRSETDKTPFTIRDAILLALTGMMEEDHLLQPAEKVRRGILAIQVYEANEIGFSTEDTVMLKQRIARMYTPVVALRAYEILDPDDDILPKS